VDSPCFAAYFGVDTQFTQRSSCCPRRGNVSWFSAHAQRWGGALGNAPFGGVPAPLLVAAQNAGGSKLLRWPGNPARGGAPPMGICGGKGSRSVHLT
jgi:ribosomal protein S27AE